MTFSLFAASLDPGALSKGNPDQIVCNPLPPVCHEDPTEFYSVYDIPHPPNRFSPLAV